jgi:hypothetical protein
VFQSFPLLFPFFCSFSLLIFLLFLSSAFRYSHTILCICSHDTQNQSSSSCADPVPSIPWQIVSTLLEKESGNSADKTTENSQGRLFQASLLESLLNILESGSESAELVDCAVRREVGGMKKIGVESSEGDTERRRRSVFITNTRLALCNAVLPTLLLILTPTPTPTLTQDPPKCENERFSFLSVRFLFSAVGVVSEEKRPAFLALVLPPIANYLCSLLAGAHTVHPQTLSFLTFSAPLFLLLFPFFQLIPLLLLLLLRM